ALPVATGFEIVAQAPVELRLVPGTVEDAAWQADDFGLAVAGDPRGRRIHRDEVQREVAHRDRLAHAAQHLRGDAAVALGVADRGDVTGGAGDAQRVAVAVARNDLATRPHPDPGAAGGAYTVLGLEVAGLADDVPLQGPLQAWKVFRMH